ncbi:MAG: peptidoglycan endopeptidase [Chthoniobacteraceae bacterium]
MFRLLISAIFAILCLTGCGAGPRSHGRYSYSYIPGKSATLEGGRAVAPASAPRAVKAAIEAGNRIAGLPYGYGCGHTRELSSAYDCSGAASWVLSQAGLLGEPTTSTAFRNYGSRGHGKWITVCARDGHVFLVVAGLRFDTGWGNSATGPRWTTHGRPMNGAVLRHPQGL